MQKFLAGFFVTIKEFSKLFERKKRSDFNQFSRARWNWIYSNKLSREFFSKEKNKKITIRFNQRT